MSKDNARLVEVVWVDSGQQMASTWTPPDLLAARAGELIDTVKTVGYVLDETKEYILLVQSIDMESSAVAGGMRIHRSAIVGERDL